MGGPKPYLHPIRTLSGAVVTDYRPNDHRWHKGLQLTASHLSGQNLWGGNTYVHGDGYLALPEKVGSMAHVAFEEVSAADGRAVIAERLTWHPHDGELWADEERRIEARDVDADTGSWSLTWTSAVTNRRHEPLRFGSPTTHGRPAAGYTGLFWRGPRAFRDGRVFTAEADGGDLMGGQAPGWRTSASTTGATATPRSSSSTPRPTTTRVTRGPTRRTGSCAATRSPRSRRPGPSTRSSSSPPATHSPVATA